MPAIRTIKCPQCHRRHFIGSPCPPKAPQRKPRSRAPIFILAFAFLTLVLLGVTLTIADVYGRGYGIAFPLLLSIVLQIMRLGYDHDDGIDLKQLIFPAPFDWSVKLERLINFWTDDRPWFRCCSLSATVAFLIATIALLAK